MSQTLTCLRAAGMFETSLASGPQWTTQDSGGWRGGITMFAAISENGVATHTASLGPYNTEKLLRFLDQLYLDLVQKITGVSKGPTYPCLSLYGTMFPQFLLWSTHPGMVQHGIQECIMPCYHHILLKPFEVFFSAWRWRVWTSCQKPGLSSMLRMAKASTLLPTLHLKRKHQRGCWRESVAKQSTGMAIKMRLVTRRETKCLRH